MKPNTTKPAATQTRRPPLTGWKKTLAIVGICVGAFVLVTAIVTFSVSFATLWRWSHPEKISWAAQSGSPMEEQGIRLYYETFRIPTENGEVEGWILPAQLSADPDNEVVAPDGYTSRTVVFASDYDSNRLLLPEVGGMDYYVDWCEAGYNVVVFDWTGSGRSEGSKNAFTLDKACELSAVTEHAAKTTGADFIVVQGFGFGCYAAAQVAAELDAVDALILDSSFTSFREAIFGNYTQWSNFDVFPFKQTTELLFPLVMGVKPDAIMLEPLKKISGKAVYVIHGEQNEMFPAAGAQMLFDAVKTSNIADIWIVPGATHLRTRSFDPETYFSKISVFLSVASAKDET